MENGIVLNNVVQPAAPSRPAYTDVMETIPHRVREFGIEARKPGRAWEAAFNGPIQSWTDPETGEALSLVTVRLSRLKNARTRELYSTNLLFYLSPAQMQGIQNVYDLARTVPFTRIRGPRTLVPPCSPRPGRVWYDPNPEGVIMEDIRQAPVTLPDGRAGFFVTGQGYRGKVIVPDGRVIHDVGVYGGYLDPQARPAQLELKHLFGGIEFACAPSDVAEAEGLTEIADGVWVRGIICRDGCGMHVESYKNSVRLPCPQTERVLIGARSMSETKQLTYFESTEGDGLSGFRAGGGIEGLPEAVGPALWERVHRVGLGSNFIPCPELGGYLGFIHVVLEKNNPFYPQTCDPRFPGIHEQYEGWVAWLDFNSGGVPVIKACVRAITPDDVPAIYQGAGELFDCKRVAFPISLERREDALHVGYGWGDRALFQAEFNYQDVTGRLARAV
jgi:hypothetical protein